MNCASPPSRCLGRQGRRGLGLHAVHGVAGVDSLWPTVCVLRPPWHAPQHRTGFVAAHSISSSPRRRAWGAVSVRSGALRGVFGRVLHGFGLDEGYSRFCVDRCLTRAALRPSTRPASCGPLRRSRRRETQKGARTRHHLTAPPLLRARPVGPATGRHPRGHAPGPDARVRWLSRAARRRDAPPSALTLWVPGRSPTPPLLNHSASPLIFIGARAPLNHPRGQAWTALDSRTRRPAPPNAACPTAARPARSADAMAVAAGRRGDGGTLLPRHAWSHGVYTLKRPRII